LASDIESAVFAFLAATPAITSLLGTQTAESIYPMRAPEGVALPFLVYHKVSGHSVHSKDGDMNLAYPHFQITCWAKEYQDAKAVQAAVRTALNGYAGPTLEGVTVPQIIVENEQDLSDPESLEYGASLDVIVWHS
jgi:uncharacterized protein DUF3168